MTHAAGPAGPTPDLAVPVERAAWRTPRGSDLVAEVARSAVDLHAAAFPDAARTVVERTVALLPCADHAAITLRARRQSHVVLAATSEVAERLESEQHGLEQGPALDAAREVALARSLDVRADTPWPTWASRATEDRIGAVLAVPLVVDGEVIGALTAYSHTVGGFGDADGEEALRLWAAHAALALHHAREDEGLRAALLTRHDIGLAQGILMERFGLDVAQSFALLTRISSTRNVKLREVAAKVVHLRDDGSGLADLLAEHGRAPAPPVAPRIA